MTELCLVCGVPGSEHEGGHDCLWGDEGKQEIVISQGSVFISSTMERVPEPDVTAMYVVKGRKELERLGELDWVGRVCPECGGVMRIVYHLGQDLELRDDVCLSCGYGPVFTQKEE